MPRVRVSGSTGDFSRSPIQEFAGWADRIWQETADQYSLSAVRTADYLRFIYPAAGASFYGVQLTERMRPAGWVQMLDCQPRDRSYFGRDAGSRAGGWCGAAGGHPIARPWRCARRPGSAHADIVISNQMHRDWTAALKSAGFWQGPSNYLLALSKELRKLMEPLDEAAPRIHFNRGDGDGRVNLYTEPS